MPRVSNNPNKNKVNPNRPLTSMGVVTHCTSDAYHKHRIDIVHECIRSIVDADQVPDELIIWDNESTNEFKKMLRGFESSIVVESYNVGLDTARRNLAQIANGSIFCYSDDDIQYEPNWLGQHLRILEAFPRVGTVSGSPIREMFKWGNKTSLQFGTDNGMKTGVLIPEQYEMDYAASVGKEYWKYKQAMIGIDDVLLEQNGVKAWGHGHHMQFVGYRDILRPFLKESPYLMNSNSGLDTAIDDAGYLRLTTYERTARHMGNIL